MAPLPKGKKKGKRGKSSKKLGKLVKK